MSPPVPQGSKGVFLEVKGSCTDHASGPKPGKRAAPEVATGSGSTAGAKKNIKTYFTKVLA